MIKPFDYRAFIKIINPIVCENRGLEMDSAKWAIKLQSVEVIQFLNQIGLPLIDFGENIQISGQQISKKQIKQMIPEVTNTEIEKVLNPILEKRIFSVSDPKWARYVSLDELRTFLFIIGETIQRPIHKVVELI
ncbi:hypothetical protein [Muricauda sp. MAR_2010_75]|uniref:hypothetical protein n=1 Tax=Allomuricauda sp. MAR_2010_75 TaxID=1250232 RepID=UPI0012E0114B|nr:hypothetical protein [Muricauda sp. MAR_2010_75]